MDRIVFDKYSSHGNHFVLVDESTQQPLTQQQRASFARHAADPACGAGADSVLFLQAFDRARTPRAAPEAASVPAYVARFFEPTGEEFLTCGNGLACIARHLHDRHGQPRAQVLVELAGRQPRWGEVGWDAARQAWWVQLAPALAHIHGFTGAGFEAREHEGLLLFGARRLTHAAPDGTAPGILACGALVYTGEPHMVVFQLSDGGAPQAWPADLPWAVEGPDLFNGPAGTAAIARAGMHVNHALRGCFPQGMNLVFARPAEQPGVIDYRCFERGLHRETLACGTGALAAGLAARRLGLVAQGPLRLRPHSARQHPRFAAAELAVDFPPGGQMLLHTQAEHVFGGLLAAPPIDTP